MASLTRYSKGYKICYRVYYPDGSDLVVFAYRTVKRCAERWRVLRESFLSSRQPNQQQTEHLS
jgi:hypothetical protein